MYVNVVQHTVVHELANIGRLYRANHYVECEFGVPAQVVACILGDFPEQR